MPNFLLIAPELLLAFMATQLLGIGIGGKKDRTDFIRYVSIAVLIVYAFSGFILGKPTGETFSGALQYDDFGYYVKFFLGISAAAALLFAKSFFKTEKLDKYEYSLLMLYAVLGMSVMVSSNSLLTLYIGVELQSLALYVMAAFNRDSLRASEAGLKYFVLGALSSGLLLYGISLVYGFTGSIQYGDIATFLSQQLSYGAIAGMVFVLCGLGFKISAAPFHMWTPDVYEGSPTPVTGFFASAPKFAAMALIARLIIEPFGGITDQWQQVIICFAVLSMFVGAVGALMQTNIKRLMAYSSIANMGYALVPLAAGTVAGIQGMLIFMTIYLITSIGIFACILQMRIRNGMVEDIKDLSGLSKTHKPLAICFTIFMLSVAGIPPLLGFFGKWMAFAPAFSSGLAWLVVLALLASVIGAFYYLRVIKTMWFDEQDHEFVQAPRELRLISLVSALLVVPVMILPFVAIRAQIWVAQAAQSLF